MIFSSEGRRDKWWCLCILLDFKCQNHQTVVENASATLLYPSVSSFLDSAICLIWAFNTWTSQFLWKAKLCLNCLFILFFMASRRHSTLFKQWSTFSRRTSSFSKCPLTSSKCLLTSLKHPLTWSKRSLTWSNCLWTYWNFRLNLSRHSSTPWKHLVMALVPSFPALH